MPNFNYETRQYEYQHVADLSPKQIAIMKRTMADLLERANRGKGIPQNVLGICANLRYLTVDIDGSLNPYDIVAELSNDWPKHQYAGEPEELRFEDSDGLLRYSEYPIKVTYRDEDEDDAELPWEGEQLKLRKELLAYMMDKLDLALSERFLTGENTSYTA